jgi:hypothetical protein
MGNYKKFGNDNTRLVKFNTDNLDNFESMQYDRFSNSMDKANALQILINNVEGDYSQLSKQLSEIAEEQYPSNEFFEDNREYKNGGGVGSSQTEFTYSVIIKPKSEQYYGVQFKQYAGSKALILANREKFSKDFDFDKSSEEFQKLLKNYSDKCSVDLDVYDSYKMIFPKNFTLNLTEQIDAEVNEILESLYYVEVTNKDNTSLYIYNEFRNEITADIKTAVEKIKSNLPIEDSYDITIRVIRMKDGEVVDTQKVLKKDKLPRIMVDWNNVKRVATIVEEEGKRFDIKYKDIIAFIREELDTPQVIKSRIKMLENLNIKEEAKDNIAKNIPIAIKLNYYLKYKMNYKNGNFNIVRAFKKGGKIKRSNESLIADSRYNALPEGRRKSKKYATIELTNGTKVRRRNANQTGDVEGGRYYSEKRPNHTDKSGKVVVSVRKKVIKKSVSVSKASDSINFVGINFKRYDYTIGGL